jgi:DNA mismatch repair protein MSH5
MQTRSCKALPLLKGTSLTAPRSLQVFENESHASVHSEKFKEGLSLYGECYHVLAVGARN